MYHSNNNLKMGIPMVNNNQQWYQIHISKGISSGWDKLQILGPDLFKKKMQDRTCSNVNSIKTFTESPNSF